MLGLARGEVSRRRLTTAAGEKLQQQAGGRGEGEPQTCRQASLVEVEKDQEQASSRSSTGLDPGQRQELLEIHVWT